MDRRATVGAVCLVLMVAVPGCTRSEPRPAPPSTSAAPTAARTGTPTPPVNTPTAAGPSENYRSYTTKCDWMWPGGGAACTVTHQNPVPPLSGVTSIAAGQHSGFNRLTFVFTHAVPTYDVRFVRELLDGGRGVPVPLENTGGVVQICFDGAQANAVTSQPPPKVALSRIVSFAKGEDFEGVVRYGIGLAGPVGADERVKVRVAEGQRADGAFVVVVDVEG
ncbi:hypothetical protein AB0M43_08860 [Longispora sp. NPDC051575]|uniref:AMIN-like domain-containing (lipo)protein n=1 Tax=Longispora sp. NPDC051575 TaxID=3154943 RepID=UPI00342337BD